MKNGYEQIQYGGVALLNLISCNGKFRFTILAANANYILI